MICLLGLGCFEVAVDIFIQQVPIYVNKQIVLTDAVKIVYGSRRGTDSKIAYDVYLDRYGSVSDAILLLLLRFPKLHCHGNCNFSLFFFSS